MGKPLMICRKISYLLALFLIASSMCAEEFSTKHFSVNIPDEMTLVSSSERHLTDTLGGWKKFGINKVKEGYGYFFSLKISKDKFSFPWCSIMLSVSERMPAWQISALGGEKRHVDQISSLADVVKHKTVYEKETYYNWFVKNYNSVNDEEMQSLSVYIPTQTGGLSFIFTVQKDSFPKYETMVFEMIKSLKPSQNIKYSGTFIESVPLVNKAYYYAGIYPVNLIGAAGIGIIIFGLFTLKKKKK